MNQNEIKTHVMDNLLDGFTFEQVIVALNCNEPVIDSNSVRKVFHEILEAQLDDAKFLLVMNTNMIIKEAKKMRGGAF